jgi:hypothetical protein
MSKMERRRFFRWSLSALLSPLYIPQMLRAQLRALFPAEIPEDQVATLHEVAAVVLPASLGRSRTDEISSEFVKWVKRYKAGAQMDSGYGFTRLRVTPAGPARDYAKQLRDLEEGARQKGAVFGALDAAAKRAVVEAALQQAGVTEIPSHPNGKHVAADLMSYFFNGSAGEDFLYNAAIQRDSCRGLPDSDKRPSRLG